MVLYILCLLGVDTETSDKLVHLRVVLVKELANLLSVPKIVALIRGHRITDCFGLQGTFSGHPVHLICSEQGRAQMEQVTPSPTKPDLKCFQGWGHQPPL